MDPPSIFPLGKSQCFVEKRAPIMFWRVSVLHKRGPFRVPKSQRFEKKKKGFFFLLKSQWKGVSFKFGERSYVLPIPIADEWRDRDCNTVVSSAR